MNNERIVYTRPDGGVSVIVPGFIMVNGKKRHATAQELLDKGHVPPDATNARVVTTAELPANRHYRNAWDDSNPETFVGVNMTKAKEIAHGRRRAKRAEEFAPKLKVVEKDAAGIPLAPNENAVAAKNEMANYKANVDDVAQVAIDAAVDAVELESIEKTHGFI